MKIKKNYFYGCIYFMVPIVLFLVKIIYDRKKISESSFDLSIYSIIFYNCILIGIVVAILLLLLLLTQWKIKEHTVYKWVVLGFYLIGLIISNWIFTPATNLIDIRYFLVDNSPFPILSLILFLFIIITNVFFIFIEKNIKNNIKK